MVSKQKVKRWLGVQVNGRVLACHVRSCRFNPKNFRKLKKKVLIAFDLLNIYRNLYLCQVLCGSDSVLAL